MKATPIKVEIKGREFGSIFEAAAEYGVSVQTAARRLREGWTPEQAFGLTASPPRHHKGVEVITSAGTFSSVSEAAEHFKVKEGTLANRLRKGWTPDEAVGLMPHKRKSKRIRPVVCQGHEFANAWDLAQHYGQNCQNVAKRLRAGWTPAQAVGVEPPPPRFRDQVGVARNHLWRQVETIDQRQFPGGVAGDFKLYLITNSVNGKEYVGVTITALDTRLRGHRHAARMGLESKLYNAMRRYGPESFTIKLLRNDATNFAELQMQEVEEIERRGTLKSGYNISPGGSVGTADPINVGTMQFNSRGAAAEYFGIDERVFNIRIGRLKWTPEQAAEIEPRPKYARRRITVAGQSFPSLKSAAEHFGVAYTLAHDRLVSKGWTLEQALGVAAPPDSVKYVGKSVTAFGKTFRSLNSCAAAFGIKAESLRKRITKDGDQIEAAIRYLQTKPRPGAKKKLPR